MTSDSSSWTIFRNNFGNSYSRKLNYYKYESEKTFELSNYLYYITYIYLGNTIWTLFVFGITLSDYRNLIGYFREILNFWLNGIKITRFFNFPRSKWFSSIFSELFSKKKLEIKKHTKIMKQKMNIRKLITILNKNIALLFLIMYCFEQLYEVKQCVSQLTQVAKIFQENNHSPNVSLLWLNEDGIIFDVGIGCESESIDQGRSYVGKKINISLCFFSRYSVYNGDGGVIYVNGGSYSMNTNYSMFYNCVCSGQGGAIYFDSLISNLRMICANSCSSHSECHFAFLSGSQVNQIEYLSVSYCSQTTSGYRSIYSQSGYQRVDNTNSSMNNAYIYSGIHIESPSSFTSSHCTFSNNMVSNSICIYFYSTSGTISMSYANIVHNNSPNSGVVYVNGAGSRKLMYCIFHNNQNTLFCVWGGSLEVSNSFIDHSSSSFSRSSSVSTSNNNSFTNSITYQLRFFNSLHCNADIPLIETNRKITFVQTCLKSYSCLYTMIVLITS